MEKRVTKCLGIRIDERTIERLDLLSEQKKRKRNWLIDQILGREMGLEFYDWKLEEAEEPPEVRED